MGAKNKQLRFWNGSGKGKLDGVSLAIAAYSQAEAIKIMATACEVPPVSVRLFKQFYFPCWGTEMKNFVTPTTPCIYIYSKIGGKKIDTPIRVF